MASGNLEIFREVFKDLNIVDIQCISTMHWLTKAK